MRVVARQRFIWPTFWDDPALGKLGDGERLLYIACFSLADDDGRLIGDPAWLRARVFGFRSVSEAKVLQMRTALSQRCSSFCVYTVDGDDYIAFLNWSDFQKPKYPKASLLPAPPLPEDSGNVPGTLGEDSPIGLGRDGLVSRDGLEDKFSNVDNPRQALQLLKTGTEERADGRTKTRVFRR